MSENGKGFWKTAPGVFSAIAAIVTAITGLLVAAHQIGLFPAGPEPTAMPAETPSSTAVIATQPMPTPMPTHTPTETPTSTSTETPTVSATVAETPTTGPPQGFYRPEGVFGELWAADGEVRQDLGWARAAQSTELWTAFQPFESGAMIWREDADQVYVLYRDGSWAFFDSTWVEGEPEQDPGIVPPVGLLQPKRGFGKVWRENAEVRSGLGWALEEEAGYVAPVQGFERGVLMRVENTTYVLVLAAGRPGTWYRR
jgi:hypothetical protein